MMACGASGDASTSSSSASASVVPHPVALAFAVAALQQQQQLTPSAPITSNSNDNNNNLSGGILPAAAAFHAAAAAAAAVLQPRNVMTNTTVSPNTKEIQQPTRKKECNDPSVHSIGTITNNEPVPQSSQSNLSSAASFAEPSSIPAPESSSQLEGHATSPAPTAGVGGGEDQGDGEAEEEEEEDAQERLAKSRARNREHARKTRLRKKAQLEALQSKVKGLEAERQVLKQNIEECSIASILLGLSSSAGDSGVKTPDTSEGATTSEVTATLELLDATATLCDSKKMDASSNRVALLAAGGKRKRFLSEAMVSCSSSSSSDSECATATAASLASALQQQQHLKVCIDGVTTVIGTGGSGGASNKSPINWKTGVYVDQRGVQKQLTTVQLEHLRRERNRMHAKMTRDRKKCFIATIEKTVKELQTDIDRMKAVLSKISTLSSAPILRSGESNERNVIAEGSSDNTRHSSDAPAQITPQPSPELSAVPGPELDEGERPKEQVGDDTASLVEPVVAEGTSPVAPKDADKERTSNCGNVSVEEDLVYPLTKRARHGFALDC